MKEEKTTIILTCDLCKNVVDGFIVGATESRRRVFTINEHVYYGDTKTLDICEDCYKKISKLIDDIDRKEVKR